MQQGVKGIFCLKCLQTYKFSFETHKCNPQKKNYQRFSKNGIKSSRQYYRCNQCKKQGKIISVISHSKECKIKQNKYIQNESSVDYLQKKSQTYEKNLEGDSFFQQSTNQSITLIYKRDGGKLEDDRRIPPSHMWQFDCTKNTHIYFLCKLCKASIRTDWISRHQCKKNKINLDMIDQELQGKNPDNFFQYRNTAFWRFHTWFRQKKIDSISYQHFCRYPEVFFLWAYTQSVFFLKYIKYSWIYQQFIQVIEEISQTDLSKEIFTILTTRRPQDEQSIIISNAKINLTTKLFKWLQGKQPEDKLHITMKFWKEGERVNLETNQKYEDIFINGNPKFYHQIRIIKKRAPGGGRKANWSKEYFTQDQIIALHKWQRRITQNRKRKHQSIGIIEQNKACMQLMNQTDDRPHQYLVYSKFVRVFDLEFRMRRIIYNIMPIDYTPKMLIQQNQIRLLENWCQIIKKRQQNKNKKSSIEISNKWKKNKLQKLTLVSKKIYIEQEMKQLKEKLLERYKNLKDWNWLQCFTLKQFEKFGFSRGQYLRPEKHIMEMIY